VFEDLIWKSSGPLSPARDGPSEIDSLGCSKRGRFLYFLCFSDFSQSFAVYIVQHTLSQYKEHFVVTVPIPCTSVLENPLDFILLFIMLREIFISCLSKELLAPNGWPCQLNFTLTSLRTRREVMLLVHMSESESGRERTSFERKRGGLVERLKGQGLDSIV